MNVEIYCHGFESRIQTLAHNRRMGDMAGIQPPQQTNSQIELPIRYFDF